MHDLLRRILTITRTELLLRFRKTLAVVITLVVAIGVYFIIPDISTGRTLIQVENARLLYTSAAVALGTGMFCVLLLSLTGYYLVSNSLRREILARTGFVVAATPITSTEYLTGKFFGNFLYLAAIAVVCMLSSMVMFLIRGETTLDPVVFLTLYAWLVIPAIAFTSAISLTFESLPALSGRLGDILFFFSWASLVGFPAALLENNVGPGWVAAFDVVGIVPIIGFLREEFHTTSMSIGSTAFDASKPPILLSGIPWSWSLIGNRLLSLLLSAMLLGLARLWFHRFNPARIKLSGRSGKNNLLRRVNIMFKPVTRFLQPLVSLGVRGSTSPSLAKAVFADVTTTLLLSPWLTIVIPVFAILSLSVRNETLQSNVVPAVVIALLVSLADVAVRDRASGMMNLLLTAPNLKRHYVQWKFLSTLVLTFCFTFIPLSRFFFTAPNTALSLFIGSIFVASGAVGLAILTGSQKAFIGVFLMLWYIAMNAKDIAAFDFVGFYGHNTLLIHLLYAGLSAILIGSAHIRYRIDS